MASSVVCKLTLRSLCSKYEVWTVRSTFSWRKTLLVGQGCSARKPHEVRSLAIQSRVREPILKNESGGLHHDLTNFTTKDFSTVIMNGRNTQLCGGPLQNVTSSRHYAKGKSKGKDKAGKKGSGKTIELSAEELDSIIDSEKFHQQLNGQLEHLKNEFSQQLSLRTSLGAFDSLTIETSDGNFPLIQLGQISQKGNQTIVINMTTSPQYIPAVKSALMNSMSLNPQQDGTTLFINIPKITKEHRESLAKTAKSMCDKLKTKLRDIQSKHLQSLKKNKSHHSEDLVFGAQHYIQEEVKSYMEKADTLTASKQKELLGK